MFPILEKTVLNPTVRRMVISAPRIAAKAEPGQFVILRAREGSERIPLTVADANRGAGTVSIIYQTAGASTLELDAFPAGSALQDVMGPLGRPTETNGLHSACVIGGGVGCAIALPVVRKLHGLGCSVDSVIGFRSSEAAILTQEFKAASRECRIMTDDGSLGEKGLVTAALQKLIESGRTYDRIFAVGPLIMMKAVSELTRPLHIPTTVSMNPIMVDGTGMCGGCRLTVDGKVRFACVDGPEFDGHLVDFDEAIRRSRVYRPMEAAAREKACRLYTEAESK